MARIIDWDLARSTARRLTSPGPKVSRDEAHAVVAQLRELAQQADSHVRSFTLLEPAGEPGRTVIVDRPGWVAANVEGFRSLLDPIADKLMASRPPSAAAVMVGSRLAGAQVGSILGYLSTKVLGQYEIFLPPDVGPGRLSLVAPNIVEVERRLDVDPRDFRLWVALHESTHKLQFTAVPWLRDYIRDQLDAYLEVTDLDPQAMIDRLLKALGAVVRQARDRDGDAGQLSLIELVQSPEQRVVLDRVTAVMSLLEGHAEYVMSAVGPEVVPTVETIRRKFRDRREQIGAFDRVVRQLLGLDAKMRQYAEGAPFVAGVVDRVGMSGFNVIWERREHLPTRAEILDPAAWISRVYGAPALPAG